MGIIAYGNPETNRTGICRLLCGKPNAIHLTFGDDCDHQFIVNLGIVYHWGSHIKDEEPMDLGVPYFNQTHLVKCMENQTKTKQSEVGLNSSEPGKETLLPRLYDALGLHQTMRCSSMRLML